MYKFRILILAMSCLYPHVSHAKSNGQSWYMGASVGRADYGRSVNPQILVSEPRRIEGGRIDMFLVGYRVNSFIAVETNFLRLTNSRRDYFVSASYDGGRPAFNTFFMEGKGFSIAPLVHFYQLSKFRLLTSFGIYVLDLREELRADYEAARGVPPIHSRQIEANLFGGVGAEFHLVRWAFLRAQWEWYNLPENTPITNFSVSIAAMF